MVRRQFGAHLPPTLLYSEHDEVAKETPTAILRRQNAESEALWPMLVDIMTSYSQDDIDLLVEGVAVLPKLVSTLPFEYRCVILGNMSASYANAVLSRARNYAHDWLHNCTDEEVHAYARFFVHMSGYLKAQSAQHGLPFVELDSAHFERHLKAAAQVLLTSQQA